MSEQGKVPVRRRLVHFDLIRIFSCLCVMIVHFNAAVSAYDGATFQYPQNSLIPNFYLDDWVYLGGIGVSLFFILSGAAQMYTYRGVRTFYRKRMLSLYPMFWMAYAIVTAIDFLQLKGIDISQPSWAIFSFIGMDGYLASLNLIGFNFYKLGEWFLGCILLLYLLFPLLHKGIEKYPIITVAAAVVIYALGVNRVDDSWFFMRIPEMLLGMLIVKYRIDEKPIALTLFGGAALLLAWLFKETAGSLTVTIALCSALFGLFTCLSRYIENERVKQLLAKGANLTYLIFLVHHQLIHRMIGGFDLVHMPRTYTYVMFVIYMALTLLLAQGLIVCNRKVMCFFQKA